MNPYWDTNILEFFFLFLRRIFHLVTGALPLSNLASDEVQFAVLALIALSCSLLGPFLVLKRMTMLANSLSHTILLGIVLTYLLLGQGMGHTMSLSVLCIASLITALLTTFLTQLLSQGFKLQEDASIGLVFTALFALGIMGITLFSRNAHLGAEVVMGNVDALHFNDLKLSLSLFVVNLLLTCLFFQKYKILSFDEKFAKSLRIATLFFNYLFMTQVAASTIGAFRAVGVLLVLAFLVGPYLIARQFSNRLTIQILLSMVVGITCSFLGVALARHLVSVYDFPVSTGGLVVCWIGVFYTVCNSFSFKRKNKPIENKINE